MIRRPNYLTAYLLDNFFDELSAVQKPMQPKEPVSFGLMKTDISEGEDGFTLSMDLPGYKKEDIHAELKDGYMTIKAETNSEKEEKDEDGKVLRKERYQGSCSRSFFVGDAITEEDIKAKLSDGVLNIFVPKKDPKPQAEETKSIVIES